MSPRERDRRSQLAQLAHGAGLLRGTLAIRERACGKPNCKCTKGEKHVSLYLVASYEGRVRQLFIPKGFLHGFCVLSETADVIYKCTDFYTPGDDFGLLWSDPDMNIDWAVSAPFLSEKDLKNPKLSEISSDLLPAYKS